MTVSLFAVAGEPPVDPVHKRHTIEISAGDLQPSSLTCPVCKLVFTVTIERLP